MNLLRLINPSLAHMYYSNYCSNLVSNHSIIRLIRVVSQFQENYAIRFLFCLDLKLHACKIPFRCDSFGILNFATKQGLQPMSRDTQWHDLSIVTWTRSMLRVPSTTCHVINYGFSSIFLKEDSLIFDYVVSWFVTSLECF